MLRQSREPGEKFGRKLSIFGKELNRPGAEILALITKELQTGFKAQSRAVVELVGINPTEIPIYKDETHHPDE